jgi:alkylation response protein AidB-like acyl-CoA dehydrogenase
MARARALQGLVRAEAPRTERQGNLMAPVVQALLDAELFYLMVPAALGGFEVDGRTYLEVVEALSAADGSTGRCVMIGAEMNGLVGANLPADVARGLLFQHGPICCVGSATRMARPPSNGRATTTGSQGAGGSRVGASTPPISLPSPRCASLGSP